MKTNQTLFLLVSLLFISITGNAQIKNFSEHSIGVLFMPIPLNIDQINITRNNGIVEEFSPEGGDLFNSGIGVALNMDFNKSGTGLGAIAYYSKISGDAGLEATDFFGALKYDIALTIDMESFWSNVEISPLIGLGNLTFDAEESDQTIGSSLYLSGGVRLTYRIVNNLFIGADVQTVPIIFDTVGLLGEDDTASDAEIDYKFIAQFNLTLRYSLF